MLAKNLLGSWIQEVERLSGGEIECLLLAGGNAFGRVDRQYDQVTDNLVDVSFGLHGAYPGRFPLTSIIELPFLVKTADAATRVLMDLVPAHLAKEHRKVKVLLLSAHNAGHLHTSKKKISSYDDLAGLRMRFPSKATMKMLGALGATPTSTHPTQVYENLSKGVLDGTVFPWDVVYSFRLAEVLKFHLQIDLYTVSFFLVMNLERYRSLDKKHRDIIDAASTQLVGKVGGWWNEADAKGLAEAKKRGNEIVTLAPSDRNKWKEKLQPMIKEYLRAIESKGLPANRVYQQVQKLVAQYEN